MSLDAFIRLVRAGSFALVHSCLLLCAACVLSVHLGMLHCIGVLVVQSGMRSGWHWSELSWGSQCSYKHVFNYLCECDGDPVTHSCVELHWGESL